MATMIIKRGVKAGIEVSDLISGLTYTAVFVSRTVRKKFTTTASSSSTGVAVFEWSANMTATMPVGVYSLEIYNGTGSTADMMAYLDGFAEVKHSNFDEI